MSEDAENKRLKAILLFGPPGSGKGTIGKSLNERAEYVHISSGDVFRGLDPDSRGGRLFHEYASKGQLVPDEITIKIIEEHVKALAASGSYVPERQILLLDGIPRTKRQAEVLKERVDVQLILMLEVPDVEVLVERLSKRAELEGRSDDKDEAILRERFKVYERQTKEVLESYPADLVRHVNANQPKFSVYEDILNILLK
ncbi:MAG: nucleoside monophosphate kinase [Chlamydiia bacterium]|nr:nucleoside monophosphate kinase [Chlamydiia bacterium]